MFIKLYQRVHKLSFILIGSLFLATACKKEPKVTPVPPVIPIPAAANREELTKDSIFLYAKETYYWNDALPTYDVFKPRTFSTFKSVVEKIKTYKIDPSTGKPID